MYVLAHLSLQVDVGRVADCDEVDRPLEYTLAWGGGLTEQVHKWDITKNETLHSLS